MSGNRHDFNFVARLMAYLQAEKMAQLKSIYFKEHNAVDDNGSAYRQKTSDN